MDNNQEVRIPEPKPRDKKKENLIIYGLSFLAVILVVGVIVILVLNQKDLKKAEELTTTTVSTTTVRPTAVTVTTTTVPVKTVEYKTTTSHTQAPSQADPNSIVTPKLNE